MAELKKKMTRWRAWTKACLDVKAIDVEAEAADKAERERIAAVLNAEQDKKDQLNEGLLGKNRDKQKIKKYEEDVGGMYGVREESGDDSMSQVSYGGSAEAEDANGQEHREDADGDGVAGKQSVDQVETGKKGKDGKDNQVN